MGQNYHRSAVQRNQKLVSKNENSTLSDEIRHFEEERGQEHGYFILPRALFSRLQSLGFTLDDLVVIEVISRLSVNTGYCYASNRYLLRQVAWRSASTESSQVRRLQRLLDKLEKHGLISRDEGETPIGLGRRIHGLFTSPRAEFAHPRTLSTPMTQASPPHDTDVTPPHDTDVTQHILRIKDLSKESVRAREALTTPVLNSKDELNEIEFEQRAGSILAAQELTISGIGAKNFRLWFETAREMIPHERERYPDASPAKIKIWAMTAAWDSLSKMIRSTRSIKAQSEAQAQAAALREQRHNKHLETVGTNQMTRLSFKAQDMLIEQHEKTRRRSWEDNPHYQAQPKIAGGQSC